MFRPQLMGHLQEGHKFFDVCSLWVNLCDTDSTYMITIIIKIKVLKPLKYVYGSIQYKII